MERNSKKKRKNRNQGNSAKLMKKWTEKKLSKRENKVKDKGIMITRSTRFGMNKKVKVKKET